MTKEAEKIGLYGAISAGIEVSLGALLHTLRIPLRGTFLSYVQAYLLVVYGRELRGKGLFSISLITALLKAFSPSGAKLKPMLYIFLQGLCFIFPTKIVGWNFVGALLGTFFLALFNLVMPFFVDYFLFGSTIVTTYLNVVSSVGSILHYPHLTLWQFLLGAGIIKIILAFGVTSHAYFCRWGTFLKQKERQFQQNKATLEQSDFHSLLPGGMGWKDSFLGAFHDFTRKRFFLPFLFTILLISFFSGIKQHEIVTVSARGLLLSWCGFVMARRINFSKLVHSLHHYAPPLFATSFEYSLKFTALIFNQKRVKSEKES